MRSMSEDHSVSQKKFNHSIFRKPSMESESGSSKKRRKSKKKTIEDKLNESVSFLNEIDKIKREKLQQVSSDEKSQDENKNILTDDLLKKTGNSPSTPNT